MLGSFWQDLIINQFMWVPFIAFFCFVLFIINYWHNWLMPLQVLLGLIGNSTFCRYKYFSILFLELHYFTRFMIDLIKTRDYNQTCSNAFIVR